MCKAFFFFVISVHNNSDTAYTYIPSKEGYIVNYNAE